MIKKKKISLICPSYNEENNIVLFYERIVKIFTEKLDKYDYELIIVDDCSIDETANILRQIAEKDKNVKVIFNNKNYGVHKSTFNAIKYVTGDSLVPMVPVDMQDTPELIIEFVEKWEKGFEVVYGVKKERDENFLIKNIRNLYYVLLTKISNTSIPPYAGEFQLIDKKIYLELAKYDDYYPYVRGIISTLSSKSIGINYKWVKRLHGESKTSFFKLLDMGINGIISFSNFPIRFFTFFGIGISIASIFFIIIQIFSHFFLDGRMSVPGLSTLIVALFFFSGIQFLFLGILGEYISAVHSQVRKAPKNVIVKETINI